MEPDAPSAVAAAPRGVWLRPPKMLTFQNVLDLHKGGPGFDFLRVFLAIAVVFDHSYVLLFGGDIIGVVWFGPLFYLIVPAFFALSGFLVAGSLERSRGLGRFFKLRFLRIFPALCGEILLSALIIGPMLTTYSVKAYFSDPLIRSYFLNLVGYMHFRLPGVFSHNMIDTVNGSLWTVPGELLCYAAIGALGFVKLNQRPFLFLLFTIAANSAYVGLLYFLHRTFAPSTYDTVPYFLAGVSFYLLRARMPLHIGLFGLCLVMLYFGIHQNFAFQKIVGPWPVAYCVAYVGLHSLPEVSKLLRGDLSYGIYLYGYPLQQVLLQTLGYQQNVFVFFILSAVGAICAASLSWRLIERPALALR